MWKSQSIESSTPSDDHPYITNNDIWKRDTSVKRISVMEHVIQEVNIAMSNFSLATLLENNIMGYDIDDKAVLIVEHTC